MNEYPFDRSLYKEVDVLDYYIDAIDYRNHHKDQSKEVALHVFTRTNTKGMLSFPVSDSIEELRYEFGALEAPGSSEDDSQSNEDYDDQVWMRLYYRIKEIKNRTV